MPTLRQRVLVSKKISHFTLVGKWTYKANQLAIAEDKAMKKFPYSELARLSKDGKSVVEIEEYDEMVKLLPNISWKVGFL